MVLGKLYKTQFRKDISGYKLDTAGQENKCSGHYGITTITLEILNPKPHVKLYISYNTKLLKFNKNTKNPISGFSFQFIPSNHVCTYLHMYTYVWIFCYKLLNLIHITNKRYSNRRICTYNTSIIKKILSWRLLIHIPLLSVDLQKY